MKHKLVSVIIPTYNRATLLTITISSVLLQDYPTLEIIIIDDGSTDDTEKLIKNLKITNLKYIKTKHVGPSSARNNGIRMARGEFLAFCDDDDEFLPQKIRLQVDLLNRNPRLSFCYTNSFISSKGNCALYRPQLNQKTFAQLLLQNSQILTPTVLTRTKIIKNVGGFNESIPICEDYDLWLRLASQSEFNFIDKPLSIVKKHDSNLTSDTKKYFTWGTKVKLDNLEKFQHLLPNNLQKITKWLIPYQRGKLYYLNNDALLARKNLFKSIQSNPLFLKSYIFIALSMINPKIFYLIFLPIFKRLIQISHK